MISGIDLNNMEQVEGQLFTFIWNFKHGDNILYNLEILQTLYETGVTAKNKSRLNKPITITIISIIEAILVDFLTRIDQATNHLPANVSRTTLDRIKAEIDSKKIPEERENSSGKYIYMKRKMYKYSEINKILKKYELFGEKNDAIYEELEKYGDMRNRVHIENYNNKLEIDEIDVFTSKRLSDIENMLTTLWQKMITDYKRPWN